MPVALLRSVRAHSRLLLALQCAGALCATAAHAQDNAPAPTANTLDQVLEQPDVRRAMA